MQKMQDLIAAFKKLINEELPATYQSPVGYNHCFNRIILDWVFNDCWYNHVNRKRTALGQLSREQLQAAVIRMEEWLQDHEKLVADNKKSLTYRRKKPEH